MNMMSHEQFLSERRLGIGGSDVAPKAPEQPAASGEGRE
jgi:hypothetical protein